MILHFRNTKIGGHWLGQCGAFDGQKFVCLDKILDEKFYETRPCMVYSFGISNDWDFENSMNDLGKIEISVAVIYKQSLLRNRFQVVSFERSTLLLTQRHQRGKTLTFIQSVNIEWPDFHIFYQIRP